VSIIKIKIFLFQQTAEWWSIIFYTIVGKLTFEVIMYLIFGSGEEQPWNISNETVIPAENNMVDPEFLKKNLRR
jgi:hypothetical protein